MKKPCIRDNCVDSLCSRVGVGRKLNPRVISEDNKICTDIVTSIADFMSLLVKIMKIYGCGVFLLFNLWWHYLSFLFYCFSAAFDGPHWKKILRVNVHLCGVLLLRTPVITKPGI